ncbi:hypothetical protein B0T18DRAFT_420307 [Schizothecium vesticola]|uniref:Uncharacterized protein n=1 Tax=Schizothecium vesticola TaxID=314040 RepID=A0AA40ELH9_9PEZI|nr:hypothetical protein B0T18DRAFT_420307 [Schizothecium vesticola]
MHYTHFGLILGLPFNSAPFGHACPMPASVHKTTMALGCSTLPMVEMTLGLPFLSHPSEQTSVPLQHAASGHSLINQERGLCYFQQFWDQQLVRGSIESPADSGPDNQPRFGLKQTGAALLSTF